MKNLNLFRGIIIIILVIVSLLITKWWFGTVVNSNLPDWLKYVLLH